VLALDHQFNALRISFVAPSGANGMITLARVRITSAAPDGVFDTRELIITPVEMVDINLQNLAPRSTGVNIPLVR
jgi:hypothetical protein